MRSLAIFLALAGLLSGVVASAQQQETLKAALVALTDDPDLRRSFEDGLAAKGRDRSYNAVTSYDIVPDVTDVNNRRFLRRMLDERVGVVLMMSPAAVGAGSSLDSVRNAVEPNVYRNMRRFAREISPSDGDDLFAVVHLAIYLLYDKEAELLSSGAVWLEEQAETQEEAIDLLQNLVLENVDAVREPIRQHLRMSPLQ